MSALAVEPGPTGLLLATIGLLLGAAALAARASGRAGIPVSLLFLGIGVLAGPEGVLGLPHADVTLAYRLGTTALVLILFDGGLNTPLAHVRRVLAPASLLATVGVIGTAGVVALGAMALGFAPMPALLLGAIVSSTDAAAVFAVLRGSGVNLRRRVGLTLELESGLNDPMAVALMIALTGALVGDAPLGPRLLVAIPLNLLIGGAVGVAIGLLGRGLLLAARLPASGLYPVLSAALALLAFGAPTLLGGSGFLAVYVAGLTLGAGTLPYRSGLVRVHDALAWLGQAAMFLVLGLLVHPTSLLDVAVPGLLLGLLVGVVARPLVVAVLLAPFGYTRKEIGYLGWVGLRGAVPIVLAIYPVLLGAPGAERIFHVVFFVVAVNALLPGMTVRPATRLLGLESDVPPAPPTVLELTSTRPLRDQVLHFSVGRVSAVAGAQIADLPFPETAQALLLVRGEELIAPKGATVLTPGDHVYVFCGPDDLPLVTLLFGRQEED